MTGLSKLVFSLCNLLCCVDWGDTASRVFIIPQFCKHFKLGSPNLSKALLHLQLCKYFLNEKFFEMLRKVCGGSNLSTVLALWGIYIKKCISPVRIRLQTRKEMKSCVARWNPGKLGRNLRRFASDEIKSASISCRKADFIVKRFHPPQVDFFRHRRI